MSTLGYDSSPTSNDLLSRLTAKQSQQYLNYEIIAQSADDVHDVTKSHLAWNPDGHSIPHQRSTRLDVPCYGTNTLHRRC
jgi:hypothetical protein